MSLNLVFSPIYFRLQKSYQVSTAILMTV